MRRTLVPTLLSILVAATLSAQQAKPSTAPPARKGSEKTAPASVGPIDLNTASQEQLEALQGVGPATAKKIIGGRPFTSVADLKRAGVSASTIAKISSSVTVSPVAQSPAAAPRPSRTEATRPPSPNVAAPAASGSPVDLNTASQEQLEALPGVGPATAKKIIGGRPFTSVADLKRAGVNASTIAKISPSVTVSSVTQSPAPRPARTEAPRPAPSPNVAAPAQGGGNGQVWVNLDSKIYHYEGDRFYGKTKNGKYMNEQDAVRAGYRASKTGGKQEK